MAGEFDTTSPHPQVTATSPSTTAVIGPQGASSSVNILIRRDARATPSSCVSGTLDAARRVVRVMRTTTQRSRGAAPAGARTNVPARGLPVGTFYLLAACVPTVSDRVTCYAQWRGIDVPARANTADFAYSGPHPSATACLGARGTGRIVPLTTLLANGESSRSPPASTTHRVANSWLAPDQVPYPLFGDGAYPRQGARLVSASRLGPT